MSMRSSAKQAGGVSLCLHLLALMVVALGLELFSNASQPPEDYLELSLTALPQSKGGMPQALPAIEAPQAPAVQKQQAMREEASASMAVSPAGIPSSAAEGGPSFGGGTSNSEVARADQVSGESGGGSSRGGEAPAGSGRVLPPRILRQTEVSYPEAMRRQRIEGRVVVSMVVLEDGSVGDASVVVSSGYGELDEAAVNTVKQWQFVPARQERGGPVRCRTTLPVGFHLQR